MLEDVYKDSWCLTIPKSALFSDLCWYRTRLLTNTKAVFTQRTKQSSRAYKKYVMERGDATHCLLQKPPVIVSFLSLNHTMVWVLVYFAVVLGEY